MATTWIKALHTGKGKSVLSALGERTGYVMDADKTDGEDLISAYECGPRTAASEFLLSKKEYAHTTGRNQGSHDVIAYHIRQSFLPGEVTPAEANVIGYELAMAFTKGRHQFIVATHTNTNSVHSHIIFNSTNLDCDRKFIDFKRSAIALRRVSDRICLEHGLSIIEKPGLSPGNNYARVIGGAKTPSARERLRALIDEALSAGTIFEDFIAAMERMDVEVKRGKHLAFKIPGGERFIRCRSLGKDYTEEALRRRVGGAKAVKKDDARTAFPHASSKPSLLIDMQSKLQEGKGEGYRRWAAGFNLKQAARTMLYLQEQGADSYEALVEKVATTTADFNGRMDGIKTAEHRMDEIVQLQKHMGAYKRTLDVYRQYRASGWSNRFYDEHAAEILLHKAAKAHFDSLGLKKLPSMQLLRQKYATLTAEKKKLYAGYKAAKEEMVAWQNAKRNVDTILRGDGTAQRNHDIGLQ